MMVKERKFEVYTKKGENLIFKTQYSTWELFLIAMYSLKRDMGNFCKKHKKPIICFSTLIIMSCVTIGGILKVYGATKFDENKFDTVEVAIPYDYETVWEAQCELAPHCDTRKMLYYSLKKNDIDDFSQIEKGKRIILFKEKDEK